MKKVEKVIKDLHIMSGCEQLSTDFLANRLIQLDFEIGINLEKKRHNKQDKIRSMLDK